MARTTIPSRPQLADGWLRIHGFSKGNIGLLNSVHRALHQAIASRGLRWTLHFNDMGPFWDVPLRGCIGAFRGAADLGSLAGSGIPVVTLSAFAWPLPANVWRSTWDKASVAPLAVAHARERGFRSGLFVGNQTDCAAAPFLAGMQAAGLPAETCEPYHPEGWAGPVLMTNAAACQYFLRRIRALPKPCLAVGAVDKYAIFVRSACHASGLSIPDEVGILSTEDDTEALTDWAPAISSVVPPATRIAEAAIDALFAAATGSSPPAQERWYPVTGLVARASTIGRRRHDPMVAMALERIQARFDPDLTVDQVVAAVPLSRRPLEIRFRRETGSSIHDAITAARIDRARSLLSGTDLPLRIIAQRIGFASVQHFCTIYRKTTGFSPGRHRRQIVASG